MPDNNRYGQLTEIAMSTGPAYITAKSFTAAFSLMDKWARFVPLRKDEKFHIVKRSKTWIVQRVVLRTLNPALSEAHLVYTDHVTKGSVSDAPHERLDVSGVDRSVTGPPHDLARP